MLQGKKFCCVRRTPDGAVIAKWHFEGQIMPSLRLQLLNGQTVEFPVADPAEPAATCFVLGVRKSGSSLLNSLIIELARLNKRPFLDIAGRFFEANVAEQDWREDPAVLQLIVAGQVHGGFRGMPPVLRRSPLWHKARKILLVRDPRDALVSEYFSTAYSHSLPQAEADEGGLRADLLAARAKARQTSVETYALDKAAALNATMSAYADVARDPLTRVFRYEDVILKKADWVRAMAAHFGWTAGSDAHIKNIMGWADVVPGEERPTQFVRKVVPGDHVNKLSPAVIGRLNQLLGTAMAAFGYH